MPNAFYLEDFSMSYFFSINHLTRLNPAISLLAILVNITSFLVVSTLLQPKLALAVLSLLFSCFGDSHGLAEADSRSTHLRRRH